MRLGVFWLVAMRGSVIKLRLRPSKCAEAGIRAAKPRIDAFQVSRSLDQGIKGGD